MARARILLGIDARRPYKKKFGRPRQVLPRYISIPGTWNDFEDNTLLTIRISAILSAKTKTNTQCQAAVREERDSEREEPSVTERFFATISRVLLSLRSVVLPVVVVSSVSRVSSMKRRVVC